MIEIEKSTVEIGLEKPLKILHITDSHLPFYCEDESYHQAEYEQLDFLKNEVEKGYPVILFTHPLAKRSEG